MIPLVRGDLACAPVSSGYAAAILADSPAVYWRLGEPSGTTMTDSSGNSRNGSYIGSPTLGVTGAVTGDTAVTFNGSSQYGEIAYAAWMDSLTAVSVEAWVKTTAGSGTYAILDRDNVSSARVWQFRLDFGKVTFIKVGGTGGTVSFTGATTVTDGNWHHVVGTYDGSNIRIYVDGAADGSAAAAGNLGTAASALAVGISHTGGGGAPTNFFPGTVDEATYYKSVLTGTQIANHYAART